ncbi:DNA cytosine methyltransferase [Sporosarcina newyorkensis]|uniref:DNA cytosine methyltransferase n=1 Tax=Sporosarcina newyorkensis TaxID=759851 RepID=UPI003D08D558
MARADGTRSSLIFETLKIIESMGTWKPRVVIGENVKIVLSKRMKLEFDRYLSDMERLSYTNNFDVLNARDFGIPQARERVFVVSRLCGSVFNFARLKKKPMQDIWSFIEDKADDRYIITQPNMLNKIGVDPTLLVAGSLLSKNMHGQ